MATKPDFALVVGERPSDEEVAEAEAEATETPTGIAAAMEEFLAAVEAKDADGMASAFHAAFMAAEKEPHAEAGEDEE